MSRTKVRGALKRAGVALPTEKLGSVGACARRRSRPAGAAPYGYCWLRGRLVPDPREIETLRIILSLWESGKSLSDIGRDLDRQRIKTRRGGRWKPATIRAIVQRHKGKSDSIEEVLWESTN